MNANTTVYTRSKAIETMVGDALSVESLVSELRSLTVSIESFCLSPLEEEVAERRFVKAVKRAGVDLSLLDYSAEGIASSSDKILQALRELIERILYELATFWTESFGHAKRLRHRADALRDEVSRLRSQRPRTLLLTDRFTITRILSPNSPRMKAPVELTRALKISSDVVLETYGAALNRWLLRLDSSDALPPAPKSVESSALPGSPELYTRDPLSIVWGVRFPTPRTAQDPTKSQLEVATRDQLLKICEDLYDTLDCIVQFEHEWHNTDRTLRQVLRQLQRSGLEGYEEARARKAAYAAASLPRQWARYSLTLAAQLKQYITVCIEQFD